MSHIESLIHNTGTRCKITGATDLAIIVNMVMDNMQENGHSVLTVSQVKDTVDRAVKEYELIMLRKLK